MSILSKVAIAVICCSVTTAYAKDSVDAMDNKMQQMLATYYLKYKELEYFSGAALSVYIPKEPIRNYFVGQVSHAKDSNKITSDTLFQIGSITKSFTSVIALQLEKEGKLSLNDTLKNWLPNYSKWSAIHLDTLLNMTSGLPNYSDTPLWNAKEYQYPEYIWKNDELIDFVYPNDLFHPPLKSGYFYSNTGYVLMDLIIEKASGKSFQEELTQRTIDRAQLANTYYPIPTMSPQIKNRMAHGYSYNQYDNPAMLGRDQENNNLSWAAAAGGIVSNGEDIIKWVKALFVDDTILDSQQKNKLTRMVSVTTGKSITQTSKTDMRGFGLGVIQAYSNNHTMRRFWFYEGETLGFRALYMYTPCNGIIIASLFNSSTNSENDHSKELMKNAYQSILNQHPNLGCK